MDRRLLLASGTYIDLSEYLLKSEAETLYAPLDAILNKQDKLISGTNIKTINGNSLLGGGDITISGGGGDYLPSTGGEISGDLTVFGTIASPTLIQASGGVNGYLRAGDAFLGIRKNIVWGNDGSYPDEYYITAEGDGTKFLSDDGTYKTISGGSSSSGGNGAYAEVNHGTSDTTFTLTPNTFHVWDEVASLTLDLGSETVGVANEFLFQFTSGATATTLSLPDDIKWANELAIEPNMIYQVSILKGLASVLEFNNEASSAPIVFYVNDTPYDAMSNMTWEEWVNSEYNTNDEFFLDGNEVNYWLDKAEDDYRYVYSRTLGAVTKSDIIVPEHSYFAD